LSDVQRARFLVCGECGELREQASAEPPALRQLCACEEGELRGAGARPIPRWPGYDFNLKAELCRLCASEVLWSGHRYCVWYCRSCHVAVREANERLGGYVIPVGRHSVHAGVLVNPRRPRREVARQAKDLVGFLTGLAERMEALERWRVGRVAAVLAEAGLASPAPLIDYLAVASEAASDPKRLVERLLRTESGLIG
jgi:hypothetical protein